MKLSIIIISYNVCNYLQQCLASIYKSNIINDIEIIVIDNHSHDMTSEMIFNKYPNIIYVQNQINMGFSKAVNIGIKKSHGDYICILNPDTLVCEATFQLLIDYLINNPKTGCIGPKILNSNGTLQLSSKRSFPYLASAFFKLIGLSKLFPKNRYFGKYNLTFLNENDIHNVDAISGSFMLMPKKIPKLVGKFDESFFMFGEDIDYCYRIKNINYDIIYHPGTSIIHYKGESCKNAPYDIIKMFYSAMQIFYKKHNSKFLSWKLLSPLVSLFIIIRRFISYLSYFSNNIYAWVIDIFCIILSFSISVYMWNYFYYDNFLNISQFFKHIPLLIDILISWTMSSYLIKLYKKDYFSYGRSIISSFLSLLIASASIYLISIIAYSRVVLLLTFFFSMLMTSFWRIIIHYLFINNKFMFCDESKLFYRRSVLLGTSNESMRIGKLLNKYKIANFIFLGYVDTHNHSQSNRFIGWLSDIEGLVKNYHINEIIIPDGYFNIKNLIKFINEIKMMNVNIKLVPKGQNMIIGKGSLENISGISLLDLEFPLFENIHNTTKRIFDIALSLILIILSFPFHCYYLIFNKLNKRELWSKDSKIINSYYYYSKINILKKLPLLFMIIKGDLSFVGSKLIDTKQTDPKHIIKPGITGLIQMQNSISNKQIMRQFDQYYAMHYSIIFDIEIIIKSLLKI